MNESTHKTQSENTFKTCVYTVEFLGRSATSRAVSPQNWGVRGASVRYFAFLKHPLIFPIQFLRSEVHGHTLSSPSTVDDYRL